MVSFIQAFKSLVTVYLPCLKVFRHFTFFKNTHFVLFCMVLFLFLFSCLKVFWVLFLFCFVFFVLVLFCFVLFWVLFCFVLFCFCFVWFCFMLFLGFDLFCSVFVLFRLNDKKCVLVFLVFFCLRF